MTADRRPLALPLSAAVIDRGARALAKAKPLDWDAMPEHWRAEPPPPGDRSAAGSDRRAAAAGPDADFRSFIFFGGTEMNTTRLHPAPEPSAAAKVAQGKSADYRDRAEELRTIADGMVSKDCARSCAGSPMIMTAWPPASFLRCSPAGRQ